MLVIICAEIEEAQHIRCSNSKILITGAGLANVIQTPRLCIRPEDKVINVGYAGSNLYPVGEVRTVNACKRLTPSHTIDELELSLKPLRDLTSAGCYTADNFIEDLNMDIPLVDMELYYLTSVYPNIQSIKIISDNLNFKEYRRADFKDSWDVVNKVLNSL